MHINTNYTTQFKYNSAPLPSKSNTHFAGAKHDEMFNENDIVIGTSSIDEYSGKKYSNIIINGKLYRFLEDGMSRHKDYLVMMDNIIKSQTGFFVSNNRCYEFIPNIYKGTPDIVNQFPLVKHGNISTQDDLATITAAENLSDFTDKKIEIDNLKTIKYIVNPYKHFDNNILKTAYSYYDTINDIFYLYLYDDRVIKTLDSNNYVKTYKI